MAYDEGLAERIRSVLQADADVTERKMFGGLVFMCAGNMFPCFEADNGEGLDNWFGILRNLSPAQTQQGRLIFDVPLTSYRLRLPDGGDPGTERFAWVEIPLRMDTDTGIESPMPAAPPAKK